MMKADTLKLLRSDTHLSDSQQAFDKKRHSHKTNRNDAPIKSSVLYNAARKLRHIPDSNDREGVYRVWDPKEESQSIDMNLKREDREKQVKQIKLDNLRKLRYEPNGRGGSHLQQRV